MSSCAGPAAGEPERVVVVVVLYNSAEHLADFLSSLPAGLAGVDHELVAVDNDSSDGSPDLVEELAPDATVIRTGRNGGYAAGINAGVAAAGPHTAVLLLNSDVRLRPGCVPELLRRMRATHAGIVVPRLTDASGRLIDSMRREPSVAHSFWDAVLSAKVAGRVLELGETVTNPAAYGVEQWVDWAEGSTQLVSRECWDVCGPWDESFFLYCEETDFDLRARDAGLGTLYVPTAEVVHLEGGSSVSVDWLWRLQQVNRVRLFRRRNGRAATLAFWLVTLLREASRAALGRSKNRAAARGLLEPRLLTRSEGAR
ncbi:glycosyltransferase family 2 protein [Microlunatus antarcticus]|uniref:GT2 family glycosyltransferase n=1 Tax=Microlunatus antarcticus TaxID=53388 RepID=A0A7W5JTK8_9ACTN|nr:glycosyltransferase family 2 protein [Microlunatus antarcticus]MBB3326101.1 GT2 family glycosyltransferase [Microlunatus antarcticus]